MWNLYDASYKRIQWTRQNYTELVTFQNSLSQDIQDEQAFSFVFTMDDNICKICEEQDLKQDIKTGFENICRSSANAAASVQPAPEKGSYRAGGNSSFKIGLAWKIWKPSLELFCLKLLCLLFSNINSLLSPINWFLLNVLQHSSAILPTPVIILSSPWILLFSISTTSSELVFQLFHFLALPTPPTICSTRIPFQLLFPFVSCSIFIPLAVFILLSTPTSFFNFPLPALLSWFIHCFPLYYTSFFLQHFML